MLVDTVDTVLSVLALLAVLLSLALVGAIVFHPKGAIVGFFRARGLAVSFMVAVLAMLGSLFYSEVAGYTPCLLCWYQRICMYPLVAVLAGGLWARSRDMRPYVLPLVVVGLAFAGYHYGLQMANHTGFCAADGVDCAQEYVFFKGFVTIPFMAAAGFLLIGLSVWLHGAPGPEKGTRGRKPQ